MKKNTSVYLFLFFCVFSCNTKNTESIKSIGDGVGAIAGAPTVTTVSPTSYGVKGGIPITVTGTNFDANSTVTVGGTTCTAPVITVPTQIVCTLPYHFASVVDVVVSNSGGISGTLFNSFSYNSYLYVANQSGSSALTRLKADSATGVITNLGTTSVPNGAYGVEVDSTNSWVYTAAVSTNQIAGFSINHATGGLTAVTGSPFTAGSGVNGVGISKDSKCLIASNWTASAATAVTSFSINQSTGALTKVADYTGGTNPGGIGIDPQNRFAFVANYGSNNISAYTLNTTNCTLAFVGSVASGTSPDAISVHSSGKFLYTGNASATGAITAMSINQSTGALSLIATYTTSNATNGAGVEIDKTGSQVYATARGGGGAGLGKVWGYNIDPNSGTLSLVNNWATNDGPNDVRILGSGLFVFTANTESNTITILSRDLATGNLNPGSPSSFTIGNSPGVMGITF